MREILISIQPYWVFLIIAKAMGWNAREKTIEVRKNFPKDENWSKKVKIYCSKNKQSFAKIPKEYQPFMEKFLGKVVGEFVCDKIIDIDYGVEEGVYFDGDFQEGFETNGEGNNPTCLSFVELEKYLTANEGYGWHISDLVVYDKARELFEFSNGSSRLEFSNTEDGFPLQWSGMTRPPQSWCYVGGRTDE